MKVAWKLPFNKMYWSDIILWNTIHWSQKEISSAISFFFAKALNIFVSSNVYNLNK